MIYIYVMYITPHLHVVNSYERYSLHFLNAIPWSCIWIGFPCMIWSFWIFQNPQIFVRHSQGNSHFGKWNPGGLPKLQRAISRVKTQWLVAFFISLESSWECRCLKWAHIIHLNIWNTSYGQKKGRESNCLYINTFICGRDPFLNNAKLLVTWLKAQSLKSHSNSLILMKMQPKHLQRLVL